MVDSKVDAPEEAPRDRPGRALARFHEARGRRIVDALGVLWAEYRTPFYLSLPYEARVDLDPRALAAALRRERVAAVRYPTRTQPGWPLGSFVCETRGYSLERVERRHRKQVQKGLDRCEIRAVDPDELRAQGLEVNLQTMARQRRFDPEFGAPRGWRRLVAAARDSPGVVVTGAFLAGRLSAYAILCRDGAWQHLLFKSTRTADMIHRINPALDFAILANASRDPTLRGVINGWPSLVSGADGLHAYKRLMGYELVQHDVAMRFHPALAALLTNRWSVAAAGALARRRPDRRVELVWRVLEAARRSRDPASAEGTAAHAES